MCVPFKVNVVYRYYRDMYYAKYYGKGGGWSAGEKNRSQGKEKRGKLHLKKGKGLKNASFWAINSKKNRGRTMCPD